LTDYAAIWDHVENLPWFTLVGIGRAGSDGFESQLDSHPEIFILHGGFFFHEFWMNGRTTSEDASAPLAEQQKGELNVHDVLDEFIGHFIFKLKTKYDYTERKDQLGDNMDQSIDTDMDIFRECVLKMLEIKPITSRTFIQSVYVAYALCHDQDVIKKKIFFHHCHHVRKLAPYLKDFPESSIIATNRDPRASYLSGVVHRRSWGDNNHPGFPLAILTRLLDETWAVVKYRNRFGVIRTEDMSSENAMRDVARWMNINYYPSMMKSTWGGLRWWGDRLSQTKPIKDEKEFIKKLRTNNWETRLPWVDKFVFNYLLNERLAWFRYEHKKMTGPFYAVVALILILFPTKFELETYHVEYILNRIKKRQWKNCFRIPYFPLKRMAYYYKLFLRRHFGERFEPYYFGSNFKK